jgi:hypothetical protein
MTTITIDVPDELADLITKVGNRLPEMLALSLRQPVLPVHIYRYILDFIASQPDANQIANFKPTIEMTERLRTLLALEKDNAITPAEKDELDEYERIEHLIVMIKSGNLPNLITAKQP